MVISTTSCGNKIGREIIGLQNNYRDTIYVLAAWAGMEHVYPDTALPINRLGMRYVPPGTKGVISETGMGGNWASSFLTLPSDTLSIYLLDAKILSLYDWSQIRDNYMILKRFDLSFQDLKSSNYIITYP
jgi:hypothetical protein